MRARRGSGVRAIAALAIAVGLTGGCSGGGGGSSTTTAPPPPPAALRITTVSLPNGLSGAPYSETLQATGGKAPYTWSAIVLPAGLSLSAAGVLSGTPQGYAYEGWQLQVTDSSSPPQSAVLGGTLYVEQALELKPPATFPDPNVTQDYSASIGTLGGFPPFTWTLVSGPQSLPPGLALSSGTYGGTISGVPTAPGTYPFTVQASETKPPYQKAQQNFSLTVTNIPVITPSTLPEGVVGKPYEGTLQAVGGTPPYTWSTNTSDMPTGLSLDATTGVISGTPTVTGSYGPPFTVTDSAVPAQQATADLQLYINPGLHFAQTTLPDGVVSRPYKDFDLIGGGIGPYTMEVQGTLPDGVAISGSGSYNPQLEGTPSASGTFSFTLSVEDSESPPVTVQQGFSIQVNPLLVVQNTQPPSTILGTPYSFQFQATGGVPPYLWSIGPLPAGLSLDSSTGVISGTPTTAGTYTFDGYVFDSASPPQQSAIFYVHDFNVYNHLKVATLSLPTIVANAPVKMQLGGFGGSGNYTWSVPAGALPPGLTLDSSGAITGHATQTGNFSFTAEVNDAGPPAQTADQALELTVSNSLGRNDTPATATPLSNGTYPASISPIADPPNGAVSPDSDYYKLTANPGATVTVEITAARLTPPSPLDSVLEIVDGSGNRLSLCSNTPTSSLGPFTFACLNDDMPQPVTTDSKLILQVPSGNSGPLTFYAHVLDWRGDARPDMVYTITVSGAN